VTACSIPRGAGVAQRILDRWSRSTVGFSPFAKAQLRRCPSSRDNTLLSCPQSDHDLRCGSATGYQRSCSKLAESGSIILTAHLRPSGACQTYQSPPQPPGSRSGPPERAHGGVGGCRLGQPSVFHQGVVGAFTEGFGLFSSDFGVGMSQDLGY